jgi:hypothetical protein
MKRVRWNRVVAAATIVGMMIWGGVELLTPEAEATGPVEYIEVTMWEGGTLWQVAEKNNPNHRHDIREVLHEDVFIEINGELVEYEDLNGRSVHPGHTILIKKD